MGCADLIVLTLVAAFAAIYGMYCWVSIYTCSWMDDFTTWGDDITGATDDSDVSCSNTSLIDDLADDIDTFSTISWIFAFVSCYFMLTMCCVGCVKSESCRFMSTPKMLGLTILAENGIIIAYIVQYFIILNKLDDMSDDTDSCGIKYESLFEKSDDYYDKLTGYPCVLTLGMYIYQFLFYCCLIYGVWKQDKSKPQSSQSGYANILSNLGSIGAPGRARTESEHLRAGLLSAITVTAYGFEFATQENCNNAMRKLSMETCSNTTALRDAIALGFGRMIELKDHLTAMNAFDHNFIHIILTDGEDTASKIERNKFLAMQYVLNRANFDTICKTVFVGVGLNTEAENELRAYSVLGGKGASFQNCDAMDIESVFNHISLTLIQRTRMAAVQTDEATYVIGQQERGLEVGFNNFLVLFTLDISGSMAGSRWTAVKKAVNSMLNNLKSTDIFGIVLFNHKSRMITGSDSIN